MIKSQVVFTPAFDNYIATCTPQGTNLLYVDNPNTPGAVQNGPPIPTIPTINGIGIGVAMPALPSDGPVQDLLVVNASDSEIRIAFAGPPGTNVTAPTLPNPQILAPAPPIGPQVVGSLIVPAQSDALLTTYANIAAAAGANSLVIGGALAAAASVAAYASIYSHGTSGTVSFMRGTSAVQYIF